MNKTEIRILKSHYGARWTEFRYNRKHTDKILCLENRFILSEIVNEPVLALNCLGENFKDIIDIHIVPADYKYQTLLLINNVEFKYKTVDQLVNLIVKYSSMHLAPNGRIIVNINMMFLIFDRLEFSLHSILDQIIQQLNNHKFKINKRLLLTKNINFGFGNIFLSLDQVHE